MVFLTELYDIEIPQRLPPPPKSKLRKRNVEVFDSGGAVIAGMPLSYIITLLPLFR
jgi:hypothetical protein